MWIFSAAHCGDQLVLGVVGAPSAVYAVRPCASRRSASRSSSPPSWAALHGIRHSYQLHIE